MEAMIGGLLLLVGPVAQQAQAQIPTVLTDKIYQGVGTINLLKNVSAATLQQYISANGGLLLGVDVNENEAGNESRTSLGIALKQVQLVITTTAGTFSYGDFLTSTTAMIRESGSASAQEFYTLFGKSGSSQINGGSAGFDLGAFDDVLRLQNVVLQGTILSAHLNVTFLSTATGRTAGANEQFFDFSGGFEDFALLGQQDAAILAAANFGKADAPAGITYTESAPVVTAPTTSGTTSTPATPAPPLWIMGAFAAASFLIGRRYASV